MNNGVRTSLVAFVVLAAGVAIAGCQTNQASAEKNSPVDDIKAGAQHIGEGASKIGEGIKQGAVKTWEAVKGGAETAADQLKGQPAASSQSQPSLPSNEEAH